MLCVSQGLLLDPGWWVSKGLAAFQEPVLSPLKPPKNKISSPPSTKVGSSLPEGNTPSSSMVVGDIPHSDMDIMWTVLCRLGATDLLLTWLMGLNFLDTMCLLRAPLVILRNMAHKYFPCSRFFFPRVKLEIYSKPCHLITHLDFIHRLCVTLCLKWDDHIMQPQSIIKEKLIHNSHTQLYTQCAVQLWLKHITLQSDLYEPTHLIESLWAVRGR